jgi:hypothetical protein
MYCVDMNKIILFIPVFLLLFVNCSKPGREASCKRYINRIFDCNKSLRKMMDPEVYVKTCTKSKWKLRCPTSSSCSEFNRCNKRQKDSK